MREQLWYITFRPWIGQSKHGLKVVKGRQKGKGSIEAASLPSYIKEFLTFDEQYSSCPDVLSVDELARCTETGNVIRLTKRGNSYIALVSIEKPKNDRPRIIEIDFDEAYSVFSDYPECSVYFDVAKTQKGWWVSATLDNLCYTGDVLIDDGPYSHKKEALTAGFDFAVEMMYLQECPDYEIDIRLKEIGLNW